MRCFGKILEVQVGMTWKFIPERLRSCTRTCRGLAVVRNASKFRDTDVGYVDRWGGGSR